MLGISVVELMYRDSINESRCSICKEWKGPSCFHFRGTKAEGRCGPRCRCCERIYRRVTSIQFLTQQDRKRATRWGISLPELWYRDSFSKRCPHCKEWKLFSFFRKGDSAVRDGFNSYCADCCRVRCRMRRINNRQTIREKDRKYRIKNKQKLRQ